MKIIYSIMNVRNEKRYIGKDSNGPHCRWNSHRRLLNRSRHPNQHLQNAWNKYGADTFIFDVLEHVNTDRQLNKREKYYIQLFDCMNSKCGYNKTSGGEENKFSEESRLKLSKNNARFWKNKHFSDKHKRLIRISKLGKPSWNKGLQHTDTHKQNLSKHHADFSGTKHPFYGKHHSIPTRIAISKNKRKVPYANVVDLNGNLYTIEPTLTSFCKIHGLIPSCMSLMLQHKSKQHKGWTLA